MYKLTIFVLCTLIGIAIPQSHNLQSHHSWLTKAGSVNRDEAQNKGDASANMKLIFNGLPDELNGLSDRFGSYQPSNGAPSASSNMQWTFHRGNGVPSSGSNFGASRQSNLVTDAQLGGLANGIPNGIGGAAEGVGAPISAGLNIFGKLEPSVGAASKVGGNYFGRGDSNSNAGASGSAFNRADAAVSNSLESVKFLQIGNKYYWIDLAHPMNWHAAHHTCRRNNAQLATIQSADELNAINSFLKSQNLLGKRFWIAGNDLAEQGKFQWVSNGQPMTFAKWSPGQPDNYRGFEHCVELWTQNMEYLMNDVNCAMNLNVICEADTSCGAISDEGYYIANWREAPQGKITGEWHGGRESWNDNNGRYVFGDHGNNGLGYWKFVYVGDVNGLQGRNSYSNRFYVPFANGQSSWGNWIAGKWVPYINTGSPQFGWNQNSYGPDGRNWYNQFYHDANSKMPPQYPYGGMPQYPYGGEQVGLSWNPGSAASNNGFGQWMGYYNGYNNGWQNERRDTGSANWNMNWYGNGGKYGLPDNSYSDKDQMMNNWGTQYPNNGGNLNMNWQQNSGYNNGYGGENAKQGEGNANWNENWPNAGSANVEFGGNKKPDEIFNNGGKAEKNGQGEWNMNWGSNGKTQENGSNGDNIDVNSNKDNTSNESESQYEKPIEVSNEEATNEKSVDVEGNGEGKSQDNGSNVENAELNKNEVNRKSESKESNNHDEGEIVTTTSRVPETTEYEKIVDDKDEIKDETVTTASSAPETTENVASEEPDLKGKSESSNPSDETDKNYEGGIEDAIVTTTSSAPETTEYETTSNAPETTENIASEEPDLNGNSENTTEVESIEGENHESNSDWNGGTNGNSGNYEWSWSWSSNGVPSGFNIKGMMGNYKIHGGIDFDFNKWMSQWITKGGSKVDFEELMKKLQNQTKNGERSITWSFKGVPSGSNVQDMMNQLKVQGGNGIDFEQWLAQWKAQGGNDAEFDEMIKKTQSQLKKSNGENGEWSYIWSWSNSGAPSGFNIQEMLNQFKTQGVNNFNFDQWKAQWTAQGGSSVEFEEMVKKLKSQAPSNGQGGSIGANTEINENKVSGSNESKSKSDGFAKTTSDEVNTENKDKIHSKSSKESVETSTDQVRTKSNSKVERNSSEESGSSESDSESDESKSDESGEKIVGGDSSTESSSLSNEQYEGEIEDAVITTTSSAPETTEYERIVDDKDEIKDETVTTASSASETTENVASEEPDLNGNSGNTTEAQITEGGNHVSNSDWIGSSNGNTENGGNYKWSWSSNGVPSGFDIQEMMENYKIHGGIDFDFNKWMSQWITKGGSEVDFEELIKILQNQTKNGEWSITWSFKGVPSGFNVQDMMNQLKVEGGNGIDFEQWLAQWKAQGGNTVDFDEMVKKMKAQLKKSNGENGEWSDSWIWSSSGAPSGFNMQDMLNQFRSQGVNNFKFDQWQAQWIAQGGNSAGFEKIVKELKSQASSNGQVGSNGGNADLNKNNDSALNKSDSQFNESIKTSTNEVQIKNNSKAELSSSEESGSSESDSDSESDELKSDESGEKTVGDDSNNKSNSPSSETDNNNGGEVEDLIITTTSSTPETTEYEKIVDNKDDFEDEMVPTTSSAPETTECNTSEEQNTNESSESNSPSNETDNNHEGKNEDVIVTTTSSAPETTEYEKIVDDKDEIEGEVVPTTSSAPETTESVPSGERNPNERSGQIIEGGNHKANSNLNGDFNGGTENGGNYEWSWSWSSNGVPSGFDIAEMMNQFKAQGGSNFKFDQWQAQWTAQGGNSAQFEEIVKKIKSQASPNGQGGTWSWSWSSGGTPSGFNIQEMMNQFKTQGGSNFNFDKWQAQWTAQGRNSAEFEEMVKKLKSQALLNGQDGTWSWSWSSSGTPSGFNMEEMMKQLKTQGETSFNFDNWLAQWTAQGGRSVDFEKLLKNMGVQTENGKWSWSNPNSHANSGLSGGSNSEVGFTGEPKKLVKKEETVKHSLQGNDSDKNNDNKKDLSIETDLPSVEKSAEVNEGDNKQNDNDVVVDPNLDITANVITDVITDNLNNGTENSTEGGGDSKVKEDLQVDEPVVKEDSAEHKSDGDEKWHSSWKGEVKDLIAKWKHRSENGVNNTKEELHDLIKSIKRKWNSKQSKDESKALINDLVSEIRQNTKSNERVPVIKIYNIDFEKFVLIGSKYYWIELDKSNWFTAQRTCHRNGGQLATITSEEEFNVLDKYLLAQTYRGTQFWTAGNDLGDEGNFSYITNSQPMSYTKWSPDQPDNHKGNENCVQLWVHNGEYMMNDENCMNSFAFICEAVETCSA